MAWLATMEEQYAALAEVGLTPSLSAAGSPMAFEDSHQWLDSSLGRSTSVIASTFDKQLIGIHLTCWQQAGGGGARARHGWELLRPLLASRFGQPAEEWGPPKRSGTRWLAGELAIDVYYSQHDLSDVMVSVLHLARTARHEATLETKSETGAGLGWTSAVIEPRDSADLQHWDVGGHTWAVGKRTNEPGTYDIDWISGPNPGYGFTIGSNDGSPIAPQELRNEISSFLANIDPATGYLD